MNRQPTGPDSIFRNLALTENCSAAIGHPEQSLHERTHHERVNLTGNNEETEADQRAKVRFLERP
jgi:hypothetical protein